MYLDYNSKRYMHSNVNSSTVYNRQDMEAASTDERIKKMDYLAIRKKNETIKFAATWANLEIITLSQSEKDKYYMVSLTCEI